MAKRKRNLGQRTVYLDGPLIARYAARGIELDSHFIRDVLRKHIDALEAGPPPLIPLAECESCSHRHFSQAAIAAAKRLALAK